jgi:hypothetical protein
VKAPEHGASVENRQQRAVSVQEKPAVGLEHVNKARGNSRSKGKLGAKKVSGCEATDKGSVQGIRGIDEPGIDVLAHSGQDDTKEPAFTASGVGLEKQKVVLFAFDGTFGARSSIEVYLPEVAGSRDEGMQAVVLLRIGVEHAAIG